MKVNLSKDGVFFTVQGEGRYTGTPSIFIRLSGCNLRCSWINTDGSQTRCDTPYTSFNPEKNLKEISEIIAEVKAVDCHHVVLTGGEPMMQKHFDDLLSALRDAGKFVTVETNGTIAPKLAEADLWSISPKLSSSASDVKLGKHHNDSRIAIESLRLLTFKGNFQMKFVVNTIEDVEEAKALCESISSGFIDLHRSKIYLMPQGISPWQFNSKLDWLIESCKQNGFNYCDRLHIRLFGNTRGT